MKTKALPRKSTAKKTPVTTAKTANKSAIAKMAGRPAKNTPDAVRNNLWHNWLTEENYLF